MNTDDVFNHGVQSLSSTQLLSPALPSIFDIGSTDTEDVIKTSSSTKCQTKNVNSDSAKNPHISSTGESLKSLVQPRSILKTQQPFSCNAKTASNCLRVLSETSSDDKAQTQALISQSASEVFDSLCFDQFFHNGECYSGCCNDSHEYKVNLHAHEKTTVWYASLFVICNAALPDLQIVKSLVQYFADKGKKLKQLAFAKCIAKMTHSNSLELAHFIVDTLSGVMPRRDTVTVILMLAFPEMPLSSARFSLLMEGIGVFQQNTSHYSELMHFLNFHSYKMPPKLVEKLMKDALEYGTLATEAIEGFLKRMLPPQFEEIRPTALLFQKTFGIRLNKHPVSVYQREKTKNNKICLRSVKFANKPDIREFQEPDDQKLDDHCDGYDESTADDQDVEEEPNFYSLPSQRIASIMRVFHDTCQSWAFKGHCSKSDCSYLHGFDESSLDRLSSEEVYTAAEFVIAKADAPPFQLLKTFVEFLAESNEIGRVLQFRKCSQKLSDQDKAKLTKLTITLLNKHMSTWEAMEKLIVVDQDGNQFYFDKDMISRMMLLAVNERTTVLRSVSHAIMRRLRTFSTEDLTEIADTCTAFLHKIVRWDLKKAPDILPIETHLTDRFVSDLKVALYNGGTNHFFLATAMLKLVIGTTVQNQAVDVLYTFLLSRYDRVQVLTQLLEQCKFFDFGTKTAVMDLLGALGLGTSIRLYENEDPHCAAELLAVLKKFKFNFFDLLPSNGTMTHSDLATFYCNVTLDTIHRHEAVDVFLNHCLQPFVQSTDNALSCPSSLVKLTDKMFRVLISSCSGKEVLKLMNGIHLKQRSFVKPLNISEYIEPTLRSSFHSSCDPRLRREGLKLYLDVVGSQTPVALQKLTYRSVFLTALMEVTSAFQKAHLKGLVNCFHPLLKKIFLKCIDEGIYAQFEPTQLTIHSSMVEAEIKVYLLWWFCLFVRARKRQRIKIFTPVTVTIAPDCAKDELQLPVHPGLRAVNASLSACAARLSSVVKNLISGPVLPSMLVSRTRSDWEMSPMVVQSLAQVAVNHLMTHQRRYSGAERMCTFCFDEKDFDFTEL